MKLWCVTMNKRLNDRAWEQLFETYDILEHIENTGCFQISAQQIREVREPRLMAKFDHTINLPQIFSDNNLSILPVTRGDYIISHFNAYHKLERTSPAVTKVSMPAHIQSLDSRNVSSEAVALNCAVASGIVADFLDDEKLLATASGRMSSGSFHFSINSLQTDSPYIVSVNNSQIEIDAAYEGIRELALFEAKRDLSEDFLVRQLYYPFRTWQSRITKPVRPVFLVYSNGIYHLYEYAFADHNNYSSIVLVQQKNYTIEDTRITADDIRQILNSAVCEAEPQIPFPQADTFERVINICELLNGQNFSQNDITDRYAFDARQTNYYTDAARYLGLVRKYTDDSEVRYKLSDKGHAILQMCYKQRQLAFCSCILSYSVFADTLRYYFEFGITPPKGEIVRFMKNARLSNINSDATFERRASTVKSWTSWIASLISE